jgi:hypothetical protein
MAGADHDYLVLFRECHSVLYFIARAKRRAAAEAAALSSDAVQR